MSMPPGSLSEEGFALNLAIIDYMNLSFQVYRIDAIGSSKNK